MLCLMSYVSYLAYEHDHVAGYLYGFMAVVMVIGFLSLLFLKNEK